jgi:glycosyltransferase involved in cell wall biosynthesis
LTIGLFAAHGGYGGTEEYLNKLLPSVARAGYKVIFFHPGDAPREWVDRMRQHARTVVWSDDQAAGATQPPAPQAASSRAASVRELYQHLLPRPARFLLGFARDARRIAGVLHRHPVDILHFNDLGADPQVLAARLAGIPRITGVLNCLPSSDPKRGGWTHRLLEALCFSCLDDMAAVSKAGKDAWARRTRLCHERVPVIFNSTEIPSLDGVRETSAEVRAEIGVPPEAAVVGVSAVLDPRKGHACLLSAFPEVLKAVPSAWLVLAGGGPARESLEAQAARLGISGRVAFLGHRRDVKRVIQAYDVIALTSIAIESLPFSLAEGMSYGKPAVGTALGGIPELIEDGVSGYIVPPGDPRATAQALIRLLADPAAAARMGRAARERVRARFNSERMVAQTLAMMLGANGNPPAAADN